MKNKTVILNIVCFLLIIYITILSISFNLHMASNNNLSMVYLIMSTVSSFEYGMATVFLSIISEMIFLFEVVLFNKYFIHTIAKIWTYVYFLYMKKEYLMTA